LHPKGIELDRTIFYPLGGGQIGDTASWCEPTGNAFQSRTRARTALLDVVLHQNRRRCGATRSGETLTLEIDWPRRYRLMRLHTALHLMSLCRDGAGFWRQHWRDRARLDFDIDMSLLDGQRIESQMNELISRCIETETVWITDDELEARPELVKTMSVQPPRGAGRVRLLRIAGVDLQPCGGTHVRNIGEIGAIRVVRVRNEGKHNRRVEIVLAD
jgi:misacylated tRNA(Ala) deacylase